MNTVLAGQETKTTVYSYFFKKNIPGTQVYTAVPRSKDIPYQDKSKHEDEARATRHLLRETRLTEQRFTPVDSSVKTR